MELGNQQERLWRLCWLAGVIDSDGSICIMSPRVNSSGRRQFRPRVNIVNTNKLLIERATQVLREFDVGAHVSTRSGCKDHWRMRGQINVDGFKRATKLLRLIEPHLVAKKEQAQIVMALWESRQNGLAGRPYNEQENILIYRARTLNQIGVTFSPETNTPESTLVS